MATIAQAHQRNESWLEMRLVESFCVTPVMPQKTSATVAKSSQPGTNDIISRLHAQEVDGNQRERESSDLLLADAFTKNRNCQNYSYDREKSRCRSNDRNFTAGSKCAEESDVPCSPQYSGDKGPGDTRMSL